MSCLVTPVRTPAFSESPTLTSGNPEKVASKLSNIAHFVLGLLFGCSHKRAGFPFEDRQTCLDCGAWRHYVLNSIFESDAPLFIGRWKPADAPNSNRTVASRLIDHAIAPTVVPEGFPRTLGLCVNCGGLRSVAGSCVCNPVYSALKAQV